MIFSMNLFLLCLVTFICLGPLGCAKPTLHPAEGEALKTIVATLGAKHLSLRNDPCQSNKLDIMTGVSVLGAANTNTVICDCRFDNNSTCRITHLILKMLNLPGRLPPELAKLVNLEEISLGCNSLRGTIPMEWASMRYLKRISLCANRLSGTLPKALARFSSVTQLILEANQFSGTIPDELGDMVNLNLLHLNSNQFVGKLPETLSRLKRITDFRASDNNFNGTIPEFMGNWSRLTRLELYASGFEGPIPSSIFGLQNLADLRITDMSGPESTFPNLSSRNVNYLVLRNLNLSGQIPVSLWKMTSLTTMDVSFNNLEGTVPADASSPKYTYLTGNMITGDLDSATLFSSTTSNVDLSYNNFTWSSGCGLLPNINAYHSLTRLLPCSDVTHCSQHQKSLHINCGGGDITITRAYGNILYQGDNDTRTGAATNYQYHGANWGYSSTGDFMDDDSTEDIYTITSAFTLAVKDSELYMTARRSPLSLTYYAFCMENGNYTVKLLFAEIQFSEDKLFSLIGRRFFNIYIQGELVWKDFNILEETNGTGKVVTKQVNITVTDHTLNIRLYWAGKGTTLIPVRGSYGPLISAISVCPSSVSHCGENLPLTLAGKTSRKNSRTRRLILIVGVITATVLLVFLLLSVYCWRRRHGSKNTRERDLKGLDLQTGSFTLRQLKAATENFNVKNKIGEGGFGSVYKSIVRLVTMKTNMVRAKPSLSELALQGELSDGTIIAVKQLSSKSNQGNREFINEIGIISALKHPNLVKLYGCCVDGNQLLLVYEYMENNCLSCWLFASGKNDLKLEWATRNNICVGVARGLAFLHEESTIKIVHRDIKATNVLLDSDLNAKISDFGLARLHEDDNTHISTRVAGTIGYMAPEYALWGHLTEKADVYSFGVLALEIVSGKGITKYKPENDFVCLLDWAFVLQKNGNITEVVDPSLDSCFNKKEAEKIIKVALLCTNASPTLRPSMSEVVSMLEGQATIQEVISDPNGYGDYGFAELKDHPHQLQGLHLSQGEGQIPATSDNTLATSSSTSDNDLYPLNPDSVISNRSFASF